MDRIFKDVVMTESRHYPGTEELMEATKILGQDSRMK
jgi:CMP-2-keto-3-deoxyoctulosonic acid synthetase